MDFSLLQKLLSHVQLKRKLWWFCLITLLLYSFISTLPPKLIKIGVDLYIQNKDLNGLLHIGLIFFTLYLVCFLLQFSYGYSLQIIGQNVISQLREMLYKKLLRAKKSFFDESSSGTILTHLTNDVESVRGFISEGIVHVAGNTLKIIVVSYFMFQTNYKLSGILFFVCGPIVTLCVLFFRNALRTGYRLVRLANSQINKMLVETLLGHKEILLNSSQNAFMEEFLPANHLYRKSFNQVITSYSLFFSTIELTSTIVLVICIFILHQRFPWLMTNPGDIYAFFAYVNIIFYPIRDMAERFNSFQSALAAAERIFSFLENTPEEDPPSTPSHPPIIWDPSQGIVFDKISFSYRTKESSALQNVNLKILPDCTVGIIGKTGSGKSTLIRLLAKLYTKQQGCIQIHGNHIESLHHDQIRERIHLISQDGILLQASVQDNITLKNPTSEAKFQEVVSFLKISHWIKKFPDAWNHVIDEQNTEISLGEKQILLIARALLQKKPIIILDEVTSHLDPFYIQIISKAIRHFLAKKTVILITHQMQLLHICNFVVVLDKGTIAEMGTPHELTEKKGLYHQYKCMQDPSLF